jgi:glycogen debranching enzyme
MDEMDERDAAPSASGGEEWLVTDGRGLFAMGTAAGVRTRKYHAFCAGIAGRGERAWLADIELRLNGASLWPHLYGPAGAPVISPDPRAGGASFAYRSARGLPRWEWRWGRARMSFAVSPARDGGIRLDWRWRGEPGERAALEVRPFFAMRPLHGIGGREWRLSREAGRAGEHRIDGAEGAPAWLWAGPGWEWRDEPVWHERFFYAEELARGYDSVERLFSAGSFGTDLARGGRGAGRASWVVSERRRRAPRAPVTATTMAASRLASRVDRAADFVLVDPPGVCAGYPWFGEWGRDTFIALPGLVASAGAAAKSGDGGAGAARMTWAEEILARWSEWIESFGMIPNLLEKGGAPQWDSADATLWWTHALAALWAQELARGRDGARLRDRFARRLSAAIASIRQGRHRGLEVGPDGIAAVAEGHGAWTWMDARVDGAPVTPRVGKLPEIGALWFQALCLERLWSAGAVGGLDELARRILRECREPARPNEVFLHSLPLAPSFVLRDLETASAQMTAVSEQLWTPRGLRTLSPLDPAYRPAYVGPQRDRDLAYHRGPAWGWLGGHYEMARARLTGVCELRPISFDAGRSRRLRRLEWGTVPGHVAELFDPEWPHAPRGAPAQSWSLACYAEAAARRLHGVDAALGSVLAQSWLAQMGR